MTNPLLPWQRFGPQVVQDAVQGVETEIENTTGIQLPQVQFPTTLPPAQPMGPVPAASLPTSAAPLPQAPTATPAVGSGGVVSSVQEGIKEAISEALPAIKAEALNYAKAELEATLSGQTIDQAHPTITVTTSKGKELKVADAKSRSYRTFIQGLGLDLFFALIALMGQLTDVDLVHKAGWLTLGALVTKTLAQTVVTYVARMRITPTTTIDGNRVSLVTIPATAVHTPATTTLHASPFVG